MSAALQSQSNPLPEGLGFRHDARFHPDPDCPVQVSLIGQSGWRTTMRGVRDISMGGVAVLLTAAEARQAVIPEPVTVELRLGEQSFFLRARTVHRTRTGRRRFLRERELGVRFEDGPDYHAVTARLERSLQELHRQGRKVGP